MLTLRNTLTHFISKFTYLLDMCYLFFFKAKNIRKLIIVNLTMSKLPKCKLNCICIIAKKVINIQLLCSNI